MNTFLLDLANWDICVDASGNLAVATDPYSITQDVASACRVFQGEEIFDTTQGLPYFQEILGDNPPFMLLKNLYVGAALSVPGVASAQVFFSGLTNRGLTGQVQIVDVTGNSLVVGF